MRRLPSKQGESNAFSKTMMTKKEDAEADRGQTPAGGLT
jgi:hypothetical protein